MQCDPNDFHSSHIQSVMDIWQLEFNYFSTSMTDSKDVIAGHDCLYQPLRKCTADSWAGIQDFRVTVGKCMHEVGGVSSSGSENSHLLRTHTCHRNRCWKPSKPQRPRTGMYPTLWTAVSSTPKQTETNHTRSDEHPLSTMLRSHGLLT